MRAGRLAAFAAAAALLVAGSIAAWHWRAFRPVAVIEHEIYRARQPSAAELCSATRQLGLRSVVNLRGAAPGEDWYRDEREASRECGLEHFDVRVWTADWPPRSEVRRLVRFLDSAETPVLLHCEAGLHRSGWASAVARLLQGAPYDLALSELSSVPRSLTEATDPYFRRFFELYDTWLSRNGASHEGDTFKEWALNHYCPPPYAAEIEILQNPAGQHAAPGTWLSYRVRVTNQSTLAWEMSSEPGSGFLLGAALLGPFDERPPDLLSIFRSRDRPGIDVGRATLAEPTMNPGDTREFDLSLRAPETPGFYVVHFDMLQEQVHWFSDLGTDGVLVDLRVSNAATSRANN